MFQEKPNKRLERQAFDKTAASFSSILDRLKSRF